jgi:AraC family transcriptional regulator of adaptative response/methylated-DNA-[protein]-cysteine methyltransferase
MASLGGKSMNESSSQGTVQDPRWRSIVARNWKSDGTFYYSVKSTGVYCHPSCAARLPKPEHVRFHATQADAEQAGFRPCKRCKPNAASLFRQHAAKVTEACRLIEQSEQAPSLDALANQAGLSPYYFHRLFKTVTGLTPRAYAGATRAKRVRAELRRNGTVTEAIYAAGYRSNGRFYEQSNDLLGMTPSTYRAGGARIDIRFAVGECSLGSILVAQSERGVCAILLGNDPERLIREFQDRFACANLVGADQTFEQLVARVVRLVETPADGLDLPLDVQGTAFQHRVWQALRNVPAGSTTTYTEIAHRIGSPKSARAVARACGANVLAVAIPCHRVVRADGAISGYRWGIARKRALLNREAGT